jgi:outer membrane protein OmpA-like peptidoglycan-associated protein
MSNNINQFGGRMFRALGLAIFLYSHSIVAGSRIVPENKFLKDVQLFPQKLKLEGDSVRFSIKGSIPIESVLTPKNPRVAVTFKSEKNQIDLGVVELKKNLASYGYEEKYSLKYEPWMAGATLEVSFYQGKNENQNASEKQILARGIIAPQLMVKLGTVYPDEPIPTVGLFITAGVPDREIIRVKDFSIQFDLGGSIYKSDLVNQKTLQEIETFLEANPTVQQIKITGIQSPESGEGKNSALGNQRAQSAKKALGVRTALIPDSLIRIDARRNDWFDLRLLLRDYKGISTDQKDELYAILMNQETYLEQNERLKKVPGFSQVAQDLYPKLRAARIEISAKPRTGLDMNQSIKLKEALSKSDGTNDLSFEEWTLAAESSQSLEEKTAIYSKMTQFFRSALPYNNMAVVRMRQAQRTLDPQSQEILWEEAQRLLTQAYRIEPNPYTIHNQGQLLVLKGMYWEAYLKLSEASSISQNPDFLIQNEALKGALDILRGDYKLATLRFDYQFSNPKDNFNKGLAYYLVGDYIKATIAFEESVEYGRGFGYGFYGLAMVAAASGQKEVALIHLKKAIDSNRQLADKAFQDPIFEELRKSEEFLSGMFQN